ncbi:hypothetical protein D3C77_34420 [compost metagenome]
MQGTVCSIVAAHEKLAKMYREAIPRLTLNFRAKYGPTLTDWPGSVVDHEPYDISKGIGHMLQQVRASGVLRVSGLHDTSLYPDAGNVGFRYAHDLTHLLYELGFDEQSEHTVHHFLWLYIRATPTWFGLYPEQKQLVAQVYRADTTDQTNYERRHGHFPPDQGAFVIKQVQRRLRHAQA